jgi:hypothetical protein
MMNRLEDKIRNYLAARLEHLENGLNFIDKEYRLPNADGTGGKIDILAKDLYGHFVVIEIKRSDQTARQAIHEILKYAALFRISQGLDESKIRLIVVSTEWKELLVPLSELAETTLHSVEGIMIAVLPNGEIENLSRVTLLRKGGGLKIIRAQTSFLYRPSAKRHRCLDKLICTVKSAGIEDFFILNCDYSGKNRGVIYPYAHYLCFSSPLLNLTRGAAEQLKKRIDWQDELDDPDDNFLTQVNSEMIGHYDDIDARFPEKLVNISENWSMAVSIREGRLSSEKSVLKDKDLISMGKAIEGGSDQYFFKTSSPKFTANWNQLRKDVKTVLIGNSKWQKVVPRFLDEIEADTPTATVSIAIYNPTNLFMTLYYIAWNQDYSKCPLLEIVVDDLGKGQVRGLLGHLVWEGRLVKDTPAGIVNRVYGDDTFLLIASAINETFLNEDAAIKAHHLAMATTEWVFEANQEKGPMEVLVKRGSLERRSFCEIKRKSLSQFSLANADYLAALRTYLQNRCTGLPGDRCE